MAKMFQDCRIARKARRCTFALVLLALSTGIQAADRSVPDQFLTPDDPIPRIAAAPIVESGETLDVLLIGNSYTASAGGQKNLLDAFLKERGYTPDIHTYIRAGETLQGFVVRNSGTTNLTYWEKRAFDRQKSDEDKAAYLERVLGDRARNKGGLDTAIAEKEWDAAVIQVWNGASMPEESDFQNSLTAIVEKIRARSPDARVVLYMVWCSQNRPADQTAISASCREGAGRLGLVLAPAGEAAWDVLSARRDVQMFRTAEDSHPGYDGGYLVACTLFAAITDTSPVGLPTRLSLPDSYDFPIPVRTPERSEKIKALGPGPMYTMDAGAEKGAALQAAAWAGYERER